jgi:GrpB-like predicted nucleotidyltransferase (UPF0157 family)
VRLVDHDPAWAALAAEMIEKLGRIFGAAASDMQHVGSTAIADIKAKPILDIAVAVDDFTEVDRLNAALEDAGILRRKWEDDAQILFAVGDYSRSGGIQTHFIHVVRTGSPQWNAYIRFRDYMNTHPQAAKAYEALKVKLAQENPDDWGREKYLAGKHDFVQQINREAQCWAYLGKTVTVTIDRPLGSYHPEKPEMYYPINYGYIADEIAPDGEDLDVYVLGVQESLETFTGKVIAIIRRRDDVEDKLVAAPPGISYTADEIMQTVAFQEKYHDSFIEME